MIKERGDMFIIDQHASDEKFNFELLSRTIKISSQDLVCPLPLTLSVTDALIVKDNLDVFRSNGFKVEFEGEANQVLLKSLPMSKKTTFTAEDFLELVQIVRDREVGMEKGNSHRKDQMLH